jgi:hypothetical protein
MLSPVIGGGMFESFEDLTSRLKATGYFIDPVMTRTVLLAAMLYAPEQK